MIVYAIIGRDYEDSYIEDKVFLEKAKAEEEKARLEKNQKDRKRRITQDYEYEIYTCELV